MTEEKKDVKIKSQEANKSIEDLLSCLFANRRKSEEAKSEKPQAKVDERELV